MLDVMTVIHCHGQLQMVLYLNDGARLGLLSMSSFFQKWKTISWVFTNIKLASYVEV